MAETTEQYRNRINQLKTGIENEPYIKKMRENIAEGISKTGNRQADIEVRQDTLEDEFVVVQQDASSASPSGAEVAVARAGFNTLDERLTTKEQQVTAQLAQKATKGEIGITDLDKNKTQFDETWMTDTFKQQMAGNTPIHAVPADKSITNIKIAKDAVSKEKINPYLMGNHMQVEKYLGKSQVVVDYKTLHDYMGISSNHLTQRSTRVNPNPSTSSGILSINIATHKNAPVTVHILERNGDNFKILTSQVFQVGLGYQELETNMIIEENQYVGIESMENYYFKQNASEKHFYLLGDVPTGFAPYTTGAGLGIGFYYIVGKGNLFDKLNEKTLEISSIVSSREPQGTVNLLQQKKQTNDTPGIGISRIRNVESQYSGELELVIDLSNIIPFTVYVFDKIGTNFNMVSKEILYPTSIGVQTFSTNLKINEGQYTGIQSVSNSYYFEVPSSHYYYQGEPALGEPKQYTTATNIELAYYFNVTVNKIDSLEKKISKNPLDSKIVYMFGDSITYWDSPTIDVVDKGRIYDVKGLGSYIRERLGATVYNRGVGGETAKQITDRLVTIDLTNAYSLIYSAGTNDVTKGVILGTINDATTANTFYGNIKRAIEYAYAQNPYIRIYLFTPHKSTRITTSDGWVNAFVEIGKLYGIPVFNAFEEIQVNNINRNAYLSDGIHFYAEGYKLFADGFIPFLANH